MFPHSFHLRAAALAVGLAATALLPLPSQEAATASQSSPQSQDVRQSALPASPATAPAGPANEEITEQQLEQRLVGKPLFLRGGYLADHLEFSADGQLANASPRGSYTLCSVEIEHVHLTKRKVELTGQRYGLHFLGALAYEGGDSPFDRVQISSGKHDLAITIDREQIEQPKKFTLLPFKLRPSEAAPSAAPIAGAVATGAPQAPGASQPSSPAVNPPGAALPTQEQADQKLIQALDHIFAPGIDAPLIASMPAFWQLYYAAGTAKTDYRPRDASVLRQDAVDRKARLLTNVEPPSNQYAQSHSVSGIALYHVVVGADGRAGEIAAARPIGFGLDENAVDTIRRASFQPALKNGSPVPVLLDLVVEFRIYADWTATHSPAAPAQPSAPVLPGPYSVRHE